MNDTTTEIPETTQDDTVREPAVRVDGEDGWWVERYDNEDGTVTVYTGHEDWGQYLCTMTADDWARFTAPRS